MNIACLNCEGWGCAECKSARSGDQGLTTVEVELAEARAEIARLRGERDDAQAAAAWAQKERDDALARYALLSKGGVA